MGGRIIGFIAKHRPVCVRVGGEAGRKAESLQHWQVAGCCSPKLPGVTCLSQAPKPQPRVYLLVLEVARQGGQPGRGGWGEG